ncbi:hypothetical protein VNI00_004100 [Paramarasmius palmivorus]|uniref:Uncharacterized protein n=1 Tax=Paramarasmius palmivorus TaxID=297713 RepID=A0AAW0DLK9_9AGAR
MATLETIQLNYPHAPQANAIEAFNKVLPQIKSAILASRKHWDQHEPRMWSRVQELKDEELVGFTIEDDLYLVRSAPTTYGTIILGKIRIPAVNDDEGEGYVHVRIHDPPNRGTEDIIFHSIFTDEGTRDEDGQASVYRAVQTKERELEFFHE